ncbi:MAG: CotH kinase family protein [Vicinamibacterales bacterium]
MKRTAAALATLLAALQMVGGAQFAGAPPPGAERKVVAQFDKNGDSRLDGAERQAARAWLATQPAGGFPGGGRGFGGGAAAPPAPGRRLGPAGVRAYPGVPLYDGGTLRTIFLTFDAPDWEQELAAFNNTDVEVPATVVVDGQTYKDVGVHFRGMSSFFMVPEGRKRSLNLSFDFVNAQQALGGYRTLNLLNANGDPTFLRGVLYTEISSRYIPTPKMNYMRVVINGESWGIYPNAQQFNKEFARDFFNTTNGARWKVPGSPFASAGLNYLGENVEDYKRLYEITSQDEPKAWADLIKLTKVLTQTPANALEAALAPILDVDGALKFLALDVVLGNSDGYWARASDYSIYQDLKGIFHIVPHDVNEGLGPQEGPPRGGGPGGPGGPGRAGPPPGFAPPPGAGAPGGRGFPGGGFPEAGPDLDPLVGLTDANKPLRSKLLAVPALRAKYLGYVRDIAERWLDWRTLGPIAQKYHDLIAADVRTDTRKIYSSAEFDAGLNGSLKEFVDARRAFLLRTVRPQ